MDYYPDRWMIVKITSNEGTHYRVFATWCGGYTQGDSWKLNSGINDVLIDDRGYHFIGHTGSVYHCNRNSYGSTSYGYSVLDWLVRDSKIQNIDIIALEEQDFSSFDWVVDRIM